MRLYYLWLLSPALARQRVEERVRSGRHDVPPETIDRRYLSGLANLRQVYLALFDEVRVYDNSGHRPRLVAHRSRGAWRIEAPETWARILREGP